MGSMYKKYLSMAALGILAFGFNSCENGNQEFPDYEGGTTVYYPYPVSYTHLLQTYT